MTEFRGVKGGMIHFHFAWKDIKGKTIIHRGDKWSGIIFILESNGEIWRGWGYEIINERENRR